MKRGAGVVLSVALLVTSCRTAPPEREKISTDVAVFAESEQPGAVVRTLPVSDVQIRTGRSPYLSHDDLVGVEVAENEFGKCLRLHLARAGAAKVHRLAAGRRAPRLVLVAKGRAIGAVRLYRTSDDDFVDVLVEVPDAELRQLALDLNASVSKPPAKGFGFGVFDSRS